MGQFKVTQQPVPVRELGASAPNGSPLPVVAPKAFDLLALGAFLLYLALSILFFGRTLFGRFSDFYFGVGVDPGLMMWSLVWWPHALVIGLNPLLTKAIWAPTGFNLAWSTSIALASVISSPLTLTLGPIATYNILCVISLPLSAFCAFLLCRYIAQDYPASLLGGYIFGFSAFMLGQLRSGHLHMMLVFSVPLCVYLALRRIAAEITRRNFTLFLAFILVAQFLLSPEIFATMTMFGAFALLLGWSFNAGQSDSIVGLLAPIACAYGIALLAVSPYLYYFLAYRVHIAPLYTPAVFSADPLNLLVPTSANELGRIAVFKSISAGFVSGWTVEAGAYLGLPLILIAVFYARRHWAERTGKLLTYCLAATIVLSFGPILHIYFPGHPLKIVLPWSILAKLPLLENTLTVRFSMYSFLVLAIISAYYFSRDLSMPAGKLMLTAAILAFGLPNLSAAYWVRPVDIPAFFQHDVYRRYLSKNEIVLILPYAYAGNSMIWQAHTQMYFNMAEGSTLPPPVEFRRWPIFPSLTKRAYIPGADEQFKAFLSVHNIKTIIVTDNALPTWRVLLSTLDARPTKVDDVWLYRFAERTGPDVETTWHILRNRFDRERLITLVTSAEKYLSQGGNLNSLSALKAEELNLIPQVSLVGPAVLLVPGLQIQLNQNIDPHLVDGVWLGETPDGLVSVGEQVWYSAVAPTVERLRVVASGIYFPYPNKLSPGAKPEEPDGWLLATFTRSQLAQAAALLKPGTEPRALFRTLPDAAGSQSDSHQADAH